MKQRFRNCMGLLVVCAFLVSLAGCNTAAPISTKEVPVATSVAPMETATPEPTVNPAESPMGKYDPPITITTILASDTDNTVIAEGNSPESNGYTREVLNKLGINIKVIWSAPGDKRDQKLSINIASNDLPDIFYVSMSQFQQLIEADMLADLKPAWDKYALPDMNTAVNADGGVAMGTAVRSNALYGIPLFTDSFSSLDMVWLRTDWLKQLNLSEPKSIDDFINILRKFKENDFAKVGKDKAIGIGLVKTVLSWAFDAKPFFNAYNAYPQIWIPDSSGNLVYGSVQPEMKQALTLLNQLYQEGIIDKSFGVKDESKIAEMATSGAVGACVGPWWMYGWPLQSNVTADPTADWQCYLLNGTDGQTIKSQVPKVSISSYNVVSKNCQNPEALIKLLNLVYDAERLTGITEESYPDMMNNDQNEPTYFWKWYVANVYPARDTFVRYQRIQKALSMTEEEGAAYLVESKELPGKSSYESILKFKNGSRDDWNTWKTFGETNSPWGLLGDSFDNKWYTYNEFYGTPTNTLTEKGAALQKIESEMLVNIIMGTAPVDSFDKFVADWKAAGGDVITEEINNWYAANK